MPEFQNLKGGYEYLFPLRFMFSFLHGRPGLLACRRMLLNSSQLPRFPFKASPDYELVLMV